MKLSSKYCLESSLLIFNEKVCFSCPELDFDSMFIRLNITIDLNYDAISYDYLAMSYIDMPYINKTIGFSSKTSCIFKQRFYQMYSVLCGSYIHFLNSSRVCYYWYKVRNNTNNSEFGIHSRTRVLSFYGLYDDYFYGVLDANINYAVNASIMLRPTVFSSVILNMLASLICIPFSNKNGLAKY